MQSRVPGTSKHSLRVDPYHQRVDHHHFNFYTLNLEKHVFQKPHFSFYKIIVVVPSIPHLKELL